MSSDLCTTCDVCGIISGMKTWALANFLREQMKGHGWSQKDLAAESGVPAPTLSRLLNTADVEPELTTLVKLSSALEVPLWRLISLAGFPVEPPANAEAQASRLVALGEAFPWLIPVMEEFAGLAADDRESILTYLEALRLRRQKTT
jgi:transcriptional regulator with XRE-family HTH domain